MVVISVSLSGKELADFDALVQHFGYGSRSRAVRDAPSPFISQHRKKFNKGDLILVLTLVYDADHGSDDLNEVIHSHQGLIRTSVHNHLGTQCVDVLVTHGDAEELHHLLDELARVKEVRVSVTALAS
jgi:metal-responsive CopG/Arc/MetJ family transcriptional regulator